MAALQRVHDEALSLITVRKVRFISSRIVANYFYWGLSVLQQGEFEVAKDFYKSEMEKRDSLRLALHSQLEHAHQFLPPLLAKV